MGVAHWGQRERGATMDEPSGIRVMQTLRKLRTTRPNRKKPAMITVLLWHGPEGDSITERYRGVGWLTGRGPAVPSMALRQGCGLYQRLASGENHVASR